MFGAVKVFGTGIQVYRVCPTGLAVSVAFVQPNGALGSWMDVEDEWLWEGKTFSSVDDAIASANA